MGGGRSLMDDDIPFPVRGFMPAFIDLIQLGKVKHSSGAMLDTAIAAGSFFRFRISEHGQMT